MGGGGGGGGGDKGVTALRIIHSAPRMRLREDMTFISTGVGTLASPAWTSLSGLRRRFRLPLASTAEPRTTPCTTHAAATAAEDDAAGV